MKALVVAVFIFGGFILTVRAQVVAKEVAFGTHFTPGADMTVSTAPAVPANATHRS